MPKSVTISDRGMACVAIPATSFDAVSSGSGATAAISWLHTPVGTPTLVVVLVYNSLVAGMTMTYGGEAMTYLGGYFNAGAPTQYVEIQYKLNPLPGPQTVVVTDVWNQPKIGGAMTFVGPTVAPSDFTATEEADGDITLTVPNTGINDFVVQVAGNKNDAAMAPQSGQTEDWDFEQAASGAHGAGYHMVANAGSTAMRVTGGVTLITAACRIPGVAMVPAGVMRYYTRNLRPSVGPSNALAEAGTFSNYGHKVRGLGGFWQCSFVWHDELSVLMEMMAEGWVRDILVMGERGMEVWEGFVAAMELTLSGGMPALKVTGYGYFRTLFWRVYNQTASGHVDAIISAEVATVVTAVGAFIASQALDVNASLVDRYHDADRNAGDILFDMCAAGNSQNHRFLIGCYEARQLRFQEIALYQTY